jgi:hypothetical protein
VFEQETSNAMMAAILISDVCDKKVRIAQIIYAIVCFSSRERSFDLRSFLRVLPAQPYI